MLVQYFGMTMAKSAPHIYISALPFAPACSLVSSHYSRTFPQILHVKQGRLSHWPSLEMMISNVGSAVCCVAFSPDGQHIVSGSSDKTICVWNATTGETVAGPFTGHTDSVNSVAFSPDGQHIVSGSDDQTICVWNATTGVMVVGPFTGHTGQVFSVAFSPDGQHIVSGSVDQTICVWNATTGEMVAGPFTGHTHSVRSVAFSPDGQHIVSGSEDKTIRLWNATTRVTESSSFIRPINSFSLRSKSVTSLPEGQYIISLSPQNLDIESGMLTHTAGNTQIAQQVDFTDCSVINKEGWICGRNGELLIWIPETHRAHLHRPSNIWVSGRYETRLDLSSFVHGQNWSTCISA
jgi:WD40 repeat protein